MALTHANSGEVVDVLPPAEGRDRSVTTTLIKTGRLEVIRLVLPAGKEIAEHRAPGEITVHCLEGSVEFRAHGRARVLRAGQLLYLDAGEPHAVSAAEDSTVLLSILLKTS